MTLEETLYYVDLVGTAVFAWSGVLRAGALRLDPFGVVVLAAVTAVGGGTLRDLILGVPVFWAEDPAALYVILATAVVGIASARFVVPEERRFLRLMDAAGLALFVGMGVQKAVAAEVPWIAAIALGTMGGVAGGMIRDVLAGVVPLILRREIYAVAAIAGASLQLGLLELEVAPRVALFAGIGTTFGIRLLALRFGLSLPAFSLGRSPQGGSGSPSTSDSAGGSDRPFSLKR